VRQPPREDAIIGAVTRLIRDRGGYVVKQHGSAYGRSGVPDLLCCYVGRFLGLEAKRPGMAGPTKLQLHELGQIRQAGGIAGVVRSREDAAAILDGVDADRGA
jgi:hypothetical protein